MTLSTKAWFEKNIGMLAEQETAPAQGGATVVHPPPQPAIDALQDSKAAQIQKIRDNALRAASKDQSAARAAATNATQAAIASAGRVAIDQYGNARFLTHIGQRYTPVRLDGQEFQDICQRIAMDTTGKPLSKDAIAATVAVLRARAVEARCCVQVHVRVATKQLPSGAPAYLLDLGNDAGQVAAITAKGWAVAHNAEFAFLGGGGALPVPIEPAGDAEAYKILSDFLERAGVPQDRVLVVIVVLCEWLRSDTMYPILNVLGVAGSGKTSLARALLSVIDPPSSGKLPEVEIEVEHIAASAQSKHVLVADNASQLSRDQQNLLCKVCYGFETSQRKLYTQTEVERLPIHNPVIVTSILPAITAPDLHNRAIRIEFKPRRDFKSQTELADVLDQERAEVLGALLTLLSAGLRHMDRSRSSPHRLVDFAQLGDGIAVALGEPQGHFSQLLSEVTRTTAADYAGGDDLIGAIQAVLLAQEAKAVAADVLPPQSTWVGGVCAIKRRDGSFCAAFAQPSELFAAIVRAKAPSPFDSDRQIPQNPRALASALNLKTPVLRDLGIEVSKRTITGHTVWGFSWRRQ